MVFWFIVAAMTLCVVLLLAYPFLGKSADGGATRAAHDVEVYRAQLRELASDVERGTLSPGEAETARAEIGRRLLKANAAASETDGERPESSLAAPNILAGAAILILIPAISISAYRYFGAAGLPDLPLSARAGPSAPGMPDDIMQLVASAEKRLEAEPDDGMGWNVLAPIYLRMGRSEEAITAFRNANRLLGPSASRDSGLGEALTQAADGQVTDEARGFFDRALSREPDYLPARFFVALDLSQEGKDADAAAAWASLIENSPEDAPWMAIATNALADARSKAGISGPAPARNAEPAAIAAETPGPTPDQVAAASQMNRGERREMIEGMVSRLAARLEAQPDDAQGWERLIQSYSVLGDGEKAAEALNEALARFSDDEAARARIAELGRSLDISGVEGSTP